MLLIVTSKADLTSDFLITRLDERRIPFERINTEDYATSYDLEIVLDRGQADFGLRIPGRSTLRRSDIRAAYLRQPIAPELTQLVNPDQLGFAQREVLEALRSIWRLIDNSLWLNSPKSLLTATNKIEQLTAAARLGLKIPATCVSSNPATIRDFVAKHDCRVIAKAVKHGFVRNSESVTVLPTQVVDNDTIACLEGYAAIPAIWQQQIEKRADLRVTIVGSHVFATAIHSQERCETSVDWRLGDLLDLPLEHEPLRLPREVEAACRALTRSFGLRYSAIDMVLTPKGDYVFLEMNPNGQWAWIEAKAGHPIRDAIIETLGL